jgi:methyl-accepting chemotaxis protein
MQSNPAAGKGTHGLAWRLRPSANGATFTLIGVTAAASTTVAIAVPSMLGSAFAAILCALALGLLGAAHWTTRSRFEKLSDSLESIGLGELSGRAETILAGESGRVVDAVHQMSRDLGELARKVRSSAKRIETGAAEIAAGSNELSQRTEEQATSLEQAASSMEELTSAVRQNSETAEQAKQLARQATDVATRGGAIVGEVVTTMREIEQASHKVADIVALIDSIALQTNILALNAAVEAARAPEQGRGFAVVAAEVRNLAQRSAEAANEVKGLIFGSVERVENGARLVGEAGQTMQDIVTSVKHVSELMDGIAEASAQQTAGIQEINQMITAMEQVTQQNAALVGETIGSSHLFEEEVAKLNDAVGHFKLDRASGRQTCVELVRRAVSHIRNVGRDRACDDFDDPRGDYLFGEFYISAFDVNGIRLANGLDPASRGEQIYESRDADGKQHVRAIIEKARTRGKGWEDYKWINPVTRRIEPKSVYFELIDNIVVTCGIYRSAAASSAMEAPRTLSAAMTRPSPLLRQPR